MGVIQKLKPRIHPQDSPFQSQEVKLVEIIVFLEKSSDRADVTPSFLSRQRKFGDHLTRRHEEGDQILNEVLFEENSEWVMRYSWMSLV